MGLLRLKVNGEYVTVAQGPAGPIGPQGPQGPQGIQGPAGVSPTTQYDPVDGSVLPSEYPLGITYGQITANTAGMPTTSDGILVTVKRSNSKIYQEFVVSNSSLSETSRYYRQGYNNPSNTINGWGPWQSLDSGPNLISEQVVSSPVSSVGWTGLDPSRYSQFELVYDFTPTAVLNPILRFNGVSAASSYHYNVLGISTATSISSNTGATEIALHRTSISSRMSGRVVINARNGTMQGNSISNDNYYQNIVVGKLITPATVGTLAFLVSTSTIASGTFRLYGVE